MARWHKLGLVSITELSNSTSTLKGEPLISSSHASHLTPLLLVTMLLPSGWPAVRPDPQWGHPSPCLPWLEWVRHQWGGASLEEVHLPGEWQIELQMSCQAEKVQLPGEWRIELQIPCQRQAEKVQFPEEWREATESWNSYRYYSVVVHVCEA